MKILTNENSERFITEQATDSFFPVSGYGWQSVFAFSLLLLVPHHLAHAEPSSSLAMEGAGKKLFMEHCASCHGVNAKGKGPASSALNAPPPDLTQIAEKRGGVFPDAEISRFVDGRMDIAAHGNREMPIWGRALQGNYAAGEIAESAVQGKIAVLIEYLKSIQQ